MYEIVTTFVIMTKLSYLKGCVSRLNLYVYVNVNTIQNDLLSPIMEKQRCSSFKIKIFTQKQSLLERQHGVD